MQRLTIALAIATTLACGEASAPASSASPPAEAPPSSAPSSSAPSSSAPSSSAPSSSAPSPAAGPASAPTTASAPTLPTASPVPARGPAVATGALLGATAELRARADASLTALLRGDRLSDPRVLATAELAGAPGRAIWVVFSESESLERWARARRDGTYAAERRAVDARIAECERDRDVGCDCCASCEQQVDDEAVPTGVRTHLARLSWPAAGALGLDAGVELGGPASSVQFREIRDIDGDGRAEISLARSTSDECGNAGAGGTSFEWFDGDTLREQLSIEHDAWAYGCSGTLKERSGFSVHDRNGDGRPDFGVRHAVWADGCGEIEGWPDPAAGTRLADAELVRRLAMGEPVPVVDGAAIPLDDPRAEDATDSVECPFFDERLRFFYDPAADGWRAAGTDG